MIRVALLALAILAAGCGKPKIYPDGGSDGPEAYCAPSPATHEMQCPYAAAVPVRLDRGLICAPEGGEIDDHDAGCLFSEIAIYPEGGTNGTEVTP